MTLGELIRFLENQDPVQKVPLGFHRPHSYRGFYSELAFEPLENTSVGTMLEEVRGALGATYEGYKGGSYKMTQSTSVYLAYYGSCGEELGFYLLRYMCGNYKVVDGAVIHA